MWFTQLARHVLHKKKILHIKHMQDLLHQFLDKSRLPNIFGSGDKQENWLILCVCVERLHDLANCILCESISDDHLSVYINKKATCMVAIYNVFTIIMMFNLPPTLSSYVKFHLIILLIHRRRTFWRVRRLR